MCLLYVDRSAVVGEATSASVLWASAKPSDCGLTEESGAAPLAGATGCTASHGEGAVAWVAATFNSDQAGWMLYCSGDTWTAATGNTMSQFSADQKWALVQPDNAASNTAPDNPEAWLRGTYTAGTQLNTRCDDAAPTGWRNGGGLYICVEALKTGNFVAAICNLGQASGDTPTCAAFQTLNDGMITTTTTDPCPREA